jgi:large subunit ribosomal protein L18
VQVMQALPQGDRTIAAADSKQLAKLGWRGGLKNLPAAYLTGHLAGHLSRNNGVASAILDLGLSKPIPGGRIFAAVKGAIDAGLEIPCGDKMFPSEKRIRGEHIAKYAKDLSKDAPETFKRQFGKVAKGRVDITTVPAMFDKTKAKIGTSSRRRSTK